MILKFKQIALLTFLTGCSSIDFIPEPDYSLANPNFRRKTWQEVEVMRERPIRPFSIMGEVIIRNEAELPWEQIEISLKKDLFDRKMDGVWMVKKKRDRIDGLSLETMDSRGHTTSNYQSENTIPIWYGYAFRYK
ncbi:MAG: hypothetical protein O9264_07580 [Leptospira sp.]|jgi:hypothetical protein|nr:hypothetical protein [Leptospira sp.]